ncbi:hypothetical protein VTN96DRAFT_1729 [Rasamsonia emersonii]
MLIILPEHSDKGCSISRFHDHTGGTPRPPARVSAASPRACAMSCRLARVSYPGAESPIQRRSEIQSDWLRLKRAAAATAAADNPCANTISIIDHLQALSKAAFLPSGSVGQVACC